MKVLHFNTYLNGGAAIAARRLHEKLVQCSINSIFAHHPCVGTDDPTYAPMFKKVKKLRKALNSLLFRFPVYPSSYYYLHKRPPGFGDFSFPIAPRNSSLDLQRQPADIVSLHWIADWIDYPSFFPSIPDSLPIIWTLHDMNPFTGGCHYSWECEKFKTGCHSCFQLNKKRGPQDISFRFAKIKRQALAGKNIHVVADSRWLEQQARTSSILGNAKSFRTIHYGLNTELFKPKDKNLCRKLLDIPETAFVICFGAASIDNKLKGFALLKEALALVHRSHPVYCLLFGCSKSDTVSDFVPHKSVGSLASIDLQTLVYSAADIFVIPSIYEAFGLTALEAMACGVPVAGFAAGGIPDMITPFENGLLAAPGDVQDLAEKIIYMIEHPEERRNMARNARQTVMQRFTADIQAGKYIELFENLLAGGGQRACA